MKAFFLKILFLGLLILPLTAVSVIAQDNPNLSDYLSSEDKKKFIDDEKNKLLNDGASDLSSNEALIKAHAELQEDLEISIQDELEKAALSATEEALFDETEPENLKANNAKVYNYKARHKDPKELAPKLWNSY
jgi:hypothetical protein